MELVGDHIPEYVRRGVSPDSERVEQVVFRTPSRIPIAQIDQTAQKHQSPSTTILMPIAK